jgi:hypothetical protein
MFLVDSNIQWSKNNIRRMLNTLLLVYKQSLSQRPPSITLIRNDKTIVIGLYMHKFVQACMHTYIHTYPLTSYLNLENKIQNLIL